MWSCQLGTKKNLITRFIARSSVYLYLSICLFSSPVRSFLQGHSTTPLPPKHVENTLQAQCPEYSFISRKLSKRRYKICICSVILGELESFRNYKGFSINFPKISLITKVIIFFIPLSITFLSPIFLSFLFLRDIT